MKVSELKYERVSLEAVKDELEENLAKIKNAGSVDEVLKAREKILKTVEEFTTAKSIAHMRYTLNTVDEFYLKEMEYYNETEPKFNNYFHQYAVAMIQSPFRAELEKALSPVLFKYYEVTAKSMSPEIIEEMVEENRLVTEYSKLMSEMTFDFRGESIPLSILRKYMKDDDRNTRKEAYEVLGRGLEKHSGELDTLYDRLVKVRDRMAKRWVTKISLSWLITGLAASVLTKRWLKNSVKTF
ncbi:hypothetical protein ODU73_001693 [Thermoclostridium stercorarium]|uniref:hypothetical protein n=1 Tax=Thermoclostridium stercorarium TaxID=1510 RepID=UPI002248D4FE|nr:hypothetical protein [Thermoclostridium stercorarium]UZQ84652.1 hypothetical protein ODU73_001693 [Thermoclostridium stercorarium]